MTATYIGLFGIIGIALMCSIGLFIGSLIITKNNA